MYRYPMNNNYLSKKILKIVKIMILNFKLNNNNKYKKKLF